MKMIRAIIRPERERHVIQALEGIEQYALTKLSSTGRGRHGAAAGVLNQAELARVMLMLVVADDRVDQVIAEITKAAFTGFPGDGRILVSAVDRIIHLRTGEVEV